MRVLFVMPSYPLCRNHPKGGAVRIAGNFDLLQREVGELHVVRLLRASDRPDVEAFEAAFPEGREFRARAASWVDFVLPEMARRPASRWAGIFSSLLHPEQNEFVPYLLSKQLGFL